MTANKEERKIKGKYIVHEGKKTVKVYGSRIAETLFIWAYKQLKTIEFYDEDEFPILIIKDTRKGKE